MQAIVASSNAPIRVCMAGSLPPPTGGVPELCVQVSRRLPSAGVTVTFVDITKHRRNKRVPDHADPYLRGSMARRLLRVSGHVPLLVRYAWQLFRDHRALLGGVRQVVRVAEMATVIHLGCTKFGRPDVIHAHHAAARALAGIVVARTLKVPCIVTIYSAEFVETWANLPLAIYCCNEADHVIAISEFALQLARELGADPAASVVYCGVDHEYFKRSADAARVRPKYGVGADDRLVLYAGWYIHRKGPDVLVEALCLLKEKGRLRSVKCVMCGPEEGLGPRLRQLVLEYGLEAHVNVTGEVPFGDLVQLHATADVFVFPTRCRTEGFGLAAAEAMASGTPVVASRIGAIPEVVEDGVTGLLATPDDPADLADKLERLLSDEPLRARMAAAGPVRMRERFSWQRAADETAAVYRKVLDSFASDR